MRVFTPIEQELIRRINTRHGFNLYTLISPWIEGISFNLGLANKKVIFIFETSGSIQPNDLIGRLGEIQKLLLQAVNLIKLLEDKGYLFTYMSSNSLPNPLIWGRAAVNLPSATHEFPDPRISELIIKYSTQEIVVTPELGKFIEDKFRTREELRANRQFYATLSALIVAIIAFIFNLGFNIYNSNKSEPQKNDCTIEYDCFNNNNGRCNECECVEYYP